MKRNLLLETVQTLKSLKAKKKQGRFTKEDEDTAVRITEMFADGYNGEDSLRWDKLKNQAWELIVPSLKRY